MQTDLIVANGNKLVEYISSIHNFNEFVEPDINTYNHMGAVITDTILQAGLNYKNVVFPRVQRVIAKFPGSSTTSGFNKVIKQNGVLNVLKWQHHEKPRRLVDLINFFLKEEIETELQLRNWLSVEQNGEKLLSIKGIGLKSVDYIMNLVGLSSVAVDRHVRNFVKNAEILCVEYEEYKNVVISAALILDLQSSALDHAIWSYMSSKSD